MKRVIKTVCIIMALMCAACLLVRCGGGEGRQADVKALAEQMRGAADFPSMLSVVSGDDNEEKGFSAVSDLSYDKVASYSLSYASDGSAYELAVIELKDESDMKALESSLKTHVENRTKQYRYYDPDEAPRAEGAVVAVHGRYAALIMCDDNAAVKAVFDKAF